MAFVKKYDESVKAFRKHLNGENAKTRYEKMKKFAEHFEMWDVLHNSGNSGVIFDYAKNCYKAVSIDYAL